ncbi:permease prefix domain 1-containing protein [Micromonospora sp. WMMA1363]|uniref:permease prefix domain 1-containing protein n=1 Tax=Micromonospora sp. WMMA1363 TaxID=3053985 RepID=UPI00259CAF5F|nr:permease prefix domain 1-containing protein [Micromonospora sp. WMMA1363]MDM4722442.1 permease prefix domain 1-containing protein [Micromonospora sp. WMMA1363]
MRGGDDLLVEERLRALGEQLRGPSGLKADLLTEARHGLLDAVEAYREGGLSTAEAHRRAVAEFGTPAQLAPAYQAELAVGALRGLSWRVLAVAAASIAAGDLTWRGASWSDGPRPPAGYLLLAASIDWLWLFAAVLGGLGVLVAGASRHSPVLHRLVGAGLAVLPALGALTGSALFGWSVGLWDGALTWPPMIIGAVLVGVGFLWLGRAARSWVHAVR